LIILDLTKCELWVIHSRSFGKTILKFHLEARDVFLISAIAQSVTYIYEEIAKIYCASCSLCLQSAHRGVNRLANYAKLWQRWRREFLVFVD